MLSKFKNKCFVCNVETSKYNILYFCCFGIMHAHRHCVCMCYECKNKFKKVDNFNQLLLFKKLLKNEKI